MPSAKPVTDHEQIRKWADARGSRPARVRDTVVHRESGASHGGGDE